MSLLNAEVASWLLAFWRLRDQVRPGEECPTPLRYEDGTYGRCVLPRTHLDIDVTPVDVPHADADGRLAPVLPIRNAIAQLRAMGLAQPASHQEQG